MKKLGTIFLLILLVAGGFVGGWFAGYRKRAAEDQAPIPAVAIKPATALKERGMLAIADNSTLYQFESNGKFHARPLNSVCGRIYEGTWTVNEIGGFPFFVVDAVRYTANGLQRPGDVRNYRIVFEIWEGKLNSKRKFAFWPPANEGVYDAYFVINELTEKSTPPRTGVE